MTRGAFLACVAGLVSAVLAQVNIQSIQPTIGSLGGSTRLQITGTGFSTDRFAGGNVIYVGPYPCSVIPHLSSNSLVTCETSPGASGNYPVTVLVDGRSSDTECCFSYSSEFTPTLRAAVPSAGPPGQQMTIYGRATWTLNNACLAVSPSFNDASCVGEVVFGDYLCRTGLSGNDAQSVYSQVWSPRYNWDNSYAINCSLPDPGPLEAAVPGLATAGNVNVSVHFEASLRGGAPWADPRSYQATATGQLYQFQLYPLVQSLSPSTGSTAGGTLLTLTGKGFPSLGLGQAPSVTLTLHGVACAVQSSNYTTLTCITGAQPAGYTPPPAVKGMWPGARGLAFDLYNGTFLRFNQLWSLSPSTQNLTSSSIKTDIWETSTELNKVPIWTLHSKAFFIAPTAGNYSFAVNADDIAMLNGSWALPNGTTTTRTLSSRPLWSYLDTYLVDDGMWSAPLPLNEGQALLLEAVASNGGSDGNLQVGARIPSDVGTPGSVPEMHKITVGGYRVRQSQVIKYLYATGSNDTVLNITITALPSSQPLLASPTSGLNITLLCSTTTLPNITVPLTASAAQLQAALVAVAAGRVPSADLGVARWEAPGSIVFQLAVNTARCQNLSLTATLVSLPDPNPPPPPCSPFTPPASPDLGTLPPPTSPPSPQPPTYPPPPSPSPAPLSALTVTVQVVVVAASPLLPSASWLLYLPGAQEDAVMLAANDSSAAVRAAIASLTGFIADVTLSIGVREGGYRAYQWLVGWPWRSGAVMPSLLVAPHTSMPAGNLVNTQRLSNASLPVTGTIQLSWANYCDSVTLDIVNDDTITMAAKLGKMPGLSAPPRQVTRTGAPDLGWVLTIQYDSAGTPGDLPLIRVANVSGLAGSPAVSVATVRNGSTAILAAPIPTEFLRLPVATPDTVDLRVNGVPAACDGGASCAFTWSAASTPVLTSVTPAAVDVTAAPATLTLAGTGFSTTGAVRVLVGGAPCAVTAASDTTLVCTLPNTTPGGMHSVQVYVEPKGLAAPAAPAAAQLLVTALAIIEVKPLNLLSTSNTSSQTFTLVNITGKGFASNCSSNRVAINQVWTGAVACSPTQLRVLLPSYPSPSGPNVTVRVDILDASGTARDSVSWVSPAAVQATGLPFVSGLLSANQVSGAGAEVTLGLGGVANSSAVVAAALLPALPLDFTSNNQFSNISAAFSTQRPITNIRNPSDMVFNGSTGSLLNAAYTPMLTLVDGTVLVAAGANLVASLAVTGISPASGSIGGGTLVTIQGTGFAPDPDENVVLITVPVSTTSLNGLALCDVQAVNQTSIICRTRAHLAADASASDPTALAVRPQATNPAPVQVVICGAGLSDLMKLDCWSQAQTARSVCAPGAACLFAFTAALTPSITSLQPQVIAAGDQVVVTGSQLAQVTRFILTNTATREQVVLDSLVASSTAVVITTPANISIGGYTVTLRQADGSLSIDTASAARFLITQNLTAVSDNVGSMAGGLPLTLSVDPPSPGFNTTALTQNRVALGPVGCTVLTATRTSLQCSPASPLGLAFAEYWNLPINTYTMPDIFSFDKPDVTTFVNMSSYITWGSGSPDPRIQPNFYATRFTWYQQIAATSNYTFWVNADDQSGLAVDDVPVLASKGSTTMRLSAGVHKFVAVQVEYAGAAYLAVQWDAGSGSAQNLPWSQVLPFPFGTPQPIRVFVNDVPMTNACNNTQPLTVALPGSIINDMEPANVTLPGNVCAYVFSTYRTPYFTAPLPASLNDPATGLQLSGALLASSLDPSLFNFSVGGVPGTIAAVSGNTSLTSLNVTGPPLPAGLWPVSLTTQGLGAVRPAPSAPSSRLTIRYNLGLAGTPRPAVGSLFGGFTTTVQGWGFVPSSGPAYGKIMVVLPANSASNPFGPVVGATLLTSTTTSLTLRLDRFLPNNQSMAITGAFSAAVALYVVDAGSPPNSTTPTTLSLSLSAAYTPSISSFSPTTLSGPAVGGNLTLVWTAPAAANAGFRPQAAGTPSNSTFQLQSGLNLYNCSFPLVLASAQNNTGYTETVSCSLPAYLPASNYTLWVTAVGTNNSIGAGLSSSRLSVPLQLGSVTPAVTSLAGGLVANLTGQGFGMDASISIAGVTAPILAVSDTVITFLTPSLAMSAASALLVVVTPTAGAMPQTSTNVSMTYDPAVTTTIASVTPTRGSSAGGTRLTFTSFNTTLPGSAGDYSIWFGANSSTACTDLVLSGNTLSCTSPAAPMPRPNGPVPATIMRAGMGYLMTRQITFEWADLWSRRSTWGGLDPPGPGDSVVIPTNTTVVLDQSTPQLYAVVVQGNLVWDELATSEVWLQASYIIVKGGNLSIGSDAVPYPGRARITLHGPPNSLELPLYGAKVLAVRDGHVHLHGQPKLPCWTQLAATADVGDSTITLLGVVNWRVGDRLVIASSSLYAEDIDERTITAVTLDTAANISMLTLDAPLTYTHLGEVVTVAGDDRGHRLDMRAEVAVLDRSIVFEGDPTSLPNQYGAQIKISTPQMGGRPRAGFYADSVLLRLTGQAFRLGSYSLHWHLHGDVAGKQYLKRSVITNTFNRAVTIHGTFGVLLSNNVAYNTMGHTFFLEDGIEQNNVIDGNLAILTRPSDALLNTDTSPASFWITNPNNTYRNNVAAGSTMGYGFWMRFLDNPDGPSTTTTVCPKFQPLGEFYNNKAHSNKFYGLRIHPEWYPMRNPCAASPLDGFWVPFPQVAAVMDTFCGYKNGVKGIIATQVGLVQFTNVTLADNGGGPLMHIVNGKDIGSNFEISWVLDDRSRENTNITDMAGLRNALSISRTDVGWRGTAGRDWNSNRRVASVTMQSPVPFNEKHSALASLINVTHVNYTSGGQFVVLEHCGKCKVFQGGATTFMAGTKLIGPPSATNPALSTWTWGSQGVFLDVDGSLLSASNLPPALVAAASFPVGQPGMTWHSAITTDMFRASPEDCVYADTVVSTPPMGNGMLCRADLKFRRVMVNGHTPAPLMFTGLWVTQQRTNTSSYITFQHYNEDGYQMVLPTQRDYWLHWDVFSSLVNATVRVDPETFSVHKMDLMRPADWLYLTAKYTQQLYGVKVNGAIADNGTSLPNTTIHGSTFYNATFDLDSWRYGNNSYNQTSAVLNLAGPTNQRVNYVAMYCPEQGCTTNPAPPSDFSRANQTLLWSNPSTWLDASLPLPQPGDNVTIPYGWNLVIDVNVSLTMFTILGNVSFSTMADIALTATYIHVRDTGSLSAGSASLGPHPRAVTIILNGTRQTPGMNFDNTLPPGAKMLAVTGGGRLSLWGQPAGQRWLKLAAATSNNTLLLSSPMHRWAVGQSVVVTSSTYNMQQAEVATIAGISPDRLTLTLTSPLAYAHEGLVKRYPGARDAADLRVEVGMLSSNIMITAADGAQTRGNGGEMFGCALAVSGASTAQLDNVALQYIGQYGVAPGLLFTSLTSSNRSSLAPGGTALTNSALLYGMDTLVALRGTRASAPVTLAGNVLLHGYDASMVEVSTPGNTVQGNLALGLVKEMVRRTQDMSTIAVFDIRVQPNFVTGNTAAGSERMGFLLAGPSCSTSSTLFRNNTAHTALAGLWLKASDAAVAEGCTGLFNFTTFLTWDFGVITTRGLPTSANFTGLVVADTKHVGLLPLFAPGMWDKFQLQLSESTFIGHSRPAVCTACTSISSAGRDTGCPSKLSAQSYNQGLPFTPSVGFVAAAFAMVWTIGPERKAWDGQMGYSTVHGASFVTNTTFADFGGSAGCGGRDGAGVFAMGNHPKAPDAAHPVVLTASTLVNVSSSGLFYFQGPDPSWRNEADCGFQTYNRSDGSVLLLNCAGPKHTHFRDVDGSLTGTVGTVNGQYSAQRSFPHDQGTPVLPGPCQFSNPWQAYQCRAGDQTWVSDPLLRPTPAPRTGINGDLQYFVLESRDADSEDRNFGPVSFNVSGSVDMVVAAQDEGWCFAYTCQKRLSTFWTYLPSFQTVWVNFTGTPPRFTRLYRPYADPSAELVLIINFLQIANRRFVFLDDSGRQAPAAQPPAVGDGSPHGSYHWNFLTSEMVVKMVGNQPLEIRREEAVAVSTTLAMSVNDFFDNQATFIASLATVLNIAPSRLRIAQVVPGSAQVTYQIYEPPSATAGPSTPPTIDTSANVDSGTAAAIALLPPAQQAAALLQQLQDIQASQNALAAAQGLPPAPTITALPPPSRPPPPSPAPPTTTSLATVLQQLAQAVSSGTLARSLGVPVTGFAVNTAAMALDPSLAAAVAQVAAAINSNPQVTSGGPLLAVPTRPPPPDNRVGTVLPSSSTPQPPATPTTAAGGSPALGTAPPPGLPVSAAAAGEAGGKATPAGVIAGAVVGSVVGATVLAAVALLAVKAVMAANVVAPTPLVV